MGQWYSHRQAGRSLPPKNVGNDVIYQVFVDRFHKGSKERPAFDDGRFSDPSRRDFFKFWGGDLRGVIDKLAYVKNLGATKLWLTPIFENEMITISREKIGKSIHMTPYHGYWIRDWFRLNPYFTDKGAQDYAIVDELIQKAGPGLGILLDTVCNHTSPTDPDGRPHDVAPFYRDGVFQGSFDQTPHCFHRFGPIENYQDPFELENHQLDGLADFDQDDGLVHGYLRDAHAFWMERFPGLAGYRMDTVKHVNTSYWEEFDRDFFSRFPDKMIVGEYFDGGPQHELAGDFFRRTRQTMFDFEFRHAMVDVFLNGHPTSRLTQVWRHDPNLVDATSLVTFFDNHDLPRLRGMGVSYEKARQALAILMIARGVPCIYYGQEQDLYLPNDSGDPLCRPMMTSFDETHDLYRLVRTLARVRKDNPALRHGETHVVLETPRLLAFERVHEGARVLLVVALERDAAVHLTGLTFPDGAYVDPLSLDEHVVKGGALSVALPAHGLLVLSTK